MTNTIYALGAATFCNVIGAGIVLLDVSVFGDTAQVFAGGIALFFSAAGAGLMVIGGRAGVSTTTTPGS